MNENNFQQVIKKIPGKLPLESNSEKQGYIGNLSSKTKLELLDLLSRQDKILNNKNFVRKLADKGEKISKFRCEIEAEIQKRNESDKLSEILNNLNIHGKEGLNNLEWTGKCIPGSLATNEKNIEDESDDETDPLKIFASHSGAGFHKKKYKVVKPEEPLIKPSDLTEFDETVCPSNSDNSSVVVEDEYAKALRSKLDSKCNQTRERFLPHRTINPPKNKEVKEKKQSKYWEVTAATPPPPVHGDTKLVSLEESILLQYSQQKKLKESQLKHAAERLAMSSYLTVGGVALNTTEYRDPQAESSSSEDESSEEEVVDEDDHGEGGVVVYNIVDS